MGFATMIVGVLLVIVIYDLMQRQHAVFRNFPMQGLDPTLKSALDRGPSVMCSDMRRTGPLPLSLSGRKSSASCFLEVRISKGG